jgi:hypothetical protein
MANLVFLFLAVIEQCYFSHFVACKCGYNIHYQRIPNAFNQEFNKFEMRTWEILDVLECIKLKTLQREMNALAEG